MNLDPHALDHNLPQIVEDAEIMSSAVTPLIWICIVCLVGLLAVLG